MVGARACMFFVCVVGGCYVALLGEKMQEKILKFLYIYNYIMLILADNPLIPNPNVL